MAAGLMGEMVNRIAEVSIDHGYRLTSSRTTCSNRTCERENIAIARVTLMCPTRSLSMVSREKSAYRLCRRRSCSSLSVRNLGS